MSPTTKEPHAVDSPIETQPSPSGSKARESLLSRVHPLSLEIPVGVQGSRRVASIPGQPEKLEQFSEETKTVIVFPHGAVIRLSTMVSAGQMVVISNRKSRQEVLCRVINVKNHPNVKGYVEIEFTQPMNGFWGVYFPQDAVRPDAGAPLEVAEPTSPLVARADGRPPVSDVKGLPLPVNIPSKISAGPVSVSPPAPIPIKAAEITSAPPSPLSKEPVSAPLGKVSAPVEPAAAARPSTSAIDDFWGSSFPTEVLAPNSSVGPLATSDSERTLPPAPKPIACAGPEPPSSAALPPSIQNSVPESDIAPELPAPTDPINEMPSPDEIWNASFLSKDNPADNGPSSMHSKSWASQAVVQLPPLTDLKMRSDRSDATTLMTSSLSTVESQPIPDLPPNDLPRIDPLADAVAAVFPDGAQESSATATSFGVLGGLDERANPLADSSSLSSVSDLLGARIDQNVPGAPYRSSSSRSMVFIAIAAVAVLGVGAAGKYLYHRGTGAMAVRQPDASSSVSQRPAASAALPTAATAAAPLEKQPSVPATQPSEPATRNTTEIKSVSKPTEKARTHEPEPEPPARRPAWAGDIPNGKLSAAPAVSAAASDQAPAPDLGAAADSSQGAVQGMFASSGNNLPPAPPAPPPTPIRIGGEVKPPRLIARSVPVYPAAARQVGIEGNVVIDGVIDANGRVTKMKVLSGPSLLRNAAMDAVQRWRYQPTLLDGKAVPVEMNITVEFHLH